jgi:signal transduction histidine kinase
MTAAAPDPAAPRPDAPEDQIDAAAQRALVGRPGLSIRARITLGFLLLLVLSAATAVTSWFLLSSVQHKLRLLVVMDRLTIEVQQARRFEKNWFLYGTNLADALEHARAAHELLAARLEGGERDPAVSPRSLAALARELDRYEERLAALAGRTGPAALPGDEQGRHELEARLREQGAKTTSMVLEMAASERRFVEGMLIFAQQVPLVFLALTLFLSIYVANLLARQMLRPLGRLVRATERIAEGDFTPIMPARRYRDEFTNLALGINHMIRELEHRHQLIVESQKLRAVGTLTAGIAHELNNPLNNITLTATTFKQFFAKLSETERAEMLDDLVTQAERSQAIVRNLLDFARQSEARMEPLDLRKLVRDVTSLAANQINFHGCTVEVEIPDALPPVHGDRNLLSQALLNLFLNALDAVGKGGHIHVGATAIREPGFVAIDVTDDGCGIPEHVIGSIFDPFFTTKPTGAGTGLGLSVARGIVRKHGGDIRAASKPGVGTTFTVLLPATTVLAKLPGARGAACG